MAYQGNSIVDYLSSTGGASDYTSRAKLAATKGISGYTGSAAQNTQLLNLLRGGGGAVTPPAPVLSVSPSPMPSPYVQPSTNVQSSTPSSIIKPTVPTSVSPSPIQFSANPNPAPSMYSMPSMNTANSTPTVAPSNNSNTAFAATVPTNTGGAPNITRNLTPTTTGDDVKQLQQWLIGQGFNIPAGATGYYGDQTKAAVTEWQKKNGMSVAPTDYGFFGPQSRALISGTPPANNGSPQSTTPPTGGTPDGSQNYGGGSPNPTPTDTSGGGGIYTPPPATTVSNPNATDNEVLKNLLSSMTPTATEIGLQGKLANLEASRRMSYQDIEGNPIATTFMTGQEAAIDKTVNNNEQTVQGQLTIAQGKRQAAIDANKTALDYSLQRQTIQKPIPTSYGGGIYDPKTGTMISNDPGTNPLISQAIQEGRLTPDMISKYSASSVLKTLQDDPNYNFITGKAGAAFTTSTDTQKFIANSNTALNTITDPTNGIIALSNKVNRGNVQVLNNGQFALKAGVSDPDTAVFVQQANILADEVSKLLGSGQGSDFAIQLGQTLVNPNYSQPAFNATMNNLVSRIQNKVTEYKSQGGQGNQSGSNFGTSGGSSSSDSSIFNF